MSRSEAVRKVSRTDLQRQMKGVWFDWRLADAIRDEAPSAYKDIRAVLKAQHDLVKVRRALKPLLNYKGT